MASEVLVPSSPAEAVELFGDGAATTVIGGGTVVVPEHHVRPARPGPRAPALAARASTASRSTATRSRSARRTPIERLLGLDESIAALAACARNVADYEIRGQGTVGGNLCVGGGPRRRAATSRAACSRSTRRCARPARTASGRSRSRSSSRSGAAGSSSTSASSGPRRRRSPRSSIRTPTSTPCSP